MQQLFCLGQLINCGNVKKTFPQAISPFVFNSLKTAKSVVIQKALFIYNL